MWALNSCSWLSLFPIPHCKSIEFLSNMYPCAWGPSLTRFSVFQGNSLSVPHLFKQPTACIYSFNVYLCCICMDKGSTILLHFGRSLSVRGLKCSSPCCLPGWPHTPCHPPPACRWLWIHPSTPASCLTWGETDVESEAATPTATKSVFQKSQTLPVWDFLLAGGFLQEVIVCLSECVQETFFNQLVQVICFPWKKHHVSSIGKTVALFFSSGTTGPLCDITKGPWGQGQKLKIKMTVKLF